MKLTKINQSGFSHIFIFLVGIVFALVIGYIGSTNIKKSEAATLDIKAATYNLRSQRWDGEKREYANWSVRANRVKEIIKKAKPSVISMQEVISVNPDTGKPSSQSKDVVKFMKKLGYIGYTGSRHNSTPVYWQKAIFDKGPVGEAVIYNSQGERASRFLTHAVVNQKNTTNQFLLLSYHFNQFEGQEDQLTKLGKQVSTLHARYPSATIIFSGDFNGKYRLVLAKLKQEGISLNLADRYNGVDHILVSKNLTIHGFDTVHPGKPPATDHHMVLAELSL